MLNISTLAAIMALPALMWASSGKVSPLEATVQMERFASNVEHAKTIHPDTAREIARLMSRPWYDCDQVRCGELLRARNHAVRTRLETLMANHRPLSDGVIAGQRDLEQIPFRLNRILRR
jgi:hypothetical protein